MAGSGTTHSASGWMVSASCLGWRNPERSHWPRLALSATILEKARPIGKIYLALAVATLAFALALPAVQSLADDAADVEAVERELEAEATALELYRRAVERANKAVEASSLGQKVKQLEKKLAAIEEALVNTRAYREWRGPDKFTALCHVCEGPENESIGSYAEYTDRMHRYFDARRSFRVDEVLEEYEAEHSRMNALQSRMVLKFLADEIARAVEQELGNLERELRELEKKARKGVTI